MLWDLQTSQAWQWNANIKKQFSVRLLDTFQQIAAVKHRHGLLHVIRQAIRSPSVNRRLSSTYSLDSQQEERVKKENRMSLPAIATSIIPYSKTIVSTNN